MKTKGIIIGILLAAVLCSCEDFEIDGLFEDFGLGFNTAYYEVEFDIPPAPAGLEISVVTPMQFDLEGELAANGYENVTVNSIQILDASLEVNEGSNVPNLNALDHINASVSTSVLPQEAIASVENTAPDQTVLPMETTDTDLTDYLSSEEYNLATTGMLKENLTDTLKMKVLVRYRVSLHVSTLE